MSGRRANPTYLPDVTFPLSLEPVAALDEALSGAQHVIVAVPSHGLRAVVRAAAPFIPAGAVLVSATKGIEADSLQRMSEVIVEETAGRYPVSCCRDPALRLRWPASFPQHSSLHRPTRRRCDASRKDFAGPTFRLYGSDDVVGVEVGAALKNIIAIAAGVTESMNLGHNALSALITRGLAEISRLACAMGGRRESLAGLSGLGDLVLTCTGALSRNRHVGVELGRGRPLDEILAGMRMVAEGVRTTHAALALGQRYDVELADRFADGLKCCPAVRHRQPPSAI
jgi:glycerol-3-phosphate dehydrogenase (NAD(P)+)